MPEWSASWGTSPPNPLGFFALNLLRQGLAGRLYKKTTQPAVCTAPDGPQVAPPACGRQAQSSIFRWSKDKIVQVDLHPPVSRFRFPAGVKGRKRKPAGSLAEA
jgi:hypothetical protein